MKLFLFIILLLFILLSCNQQESNNKSDTEIICILPIEAQPSFRGGIESFKKFIKENLKYPKGLDFEGIAFVSFVVNEDGSLSEIKIVRGVCDECDKNAIEVFKQMPKWNPAMVDGKAVKMRMVYPVKFSL